MANKKFVPYKLLSSKLSKLPIAEGQLVLATDTKKLYFDISNTERILVSPDAIVSFSVNGTTVTFTRADGTTGSFNTANTTYSVATTSKDGLMSSADKTKLDGIESGAQKNTVTGVKGNSESEYRTGQVNITKANIGLNNVENKSSATIRGEITATNVTTALGYIPLNMTLKGANNGVAELGADGKVPSSQLPSYVDDVLEYNAKVDFPTTGETGKIYVDKTTNKTWRWSGTDYIEISASLALGETSSTAYRGDRGKIAYNHATAKGSAFSNGLYKITTNEEGHVTAAIAVTKDDITGLGIPGQDTTYNNATTSAAGLMSADDKTKMNNTNIAYGTCSTAAATAAKVITVSGNTKWALTAGSIIGIRFTNTNTAQNPTLNVNNTGAKRVWYNTGLLSTSNLSYAGYANRTIYFMYDGTQYVFMGWSLDSNSTYNNEILGSGYVTCTTAEATTAKVGTLSNYNLVRGGIVSVKFTNAVPANSTLNINDKGAKNIFYQGVAIVNGIIEAGDLATLIYDGTQYHLLSIDRKISEKGTKVIASVEEPAEVKSGDIWIVVEDGITIDDSGSGDTGGGDLPS